MGHTELERNGPKVDLGRQAREIKRKMWAHFQGPLEEERARIRGHLVVDPAAGDRRVWALRVPGCLDYK